MAYPTKPTFVYQGGWSETTRAHPALKWFEGYVTEIIDQRKFDTPLEEWHASDWTYVKSDGTSIAAGEASWKALAETYAVFTSQLHDPNGLACWETDVGGVTGWSMYGLATIYGNLVGDPSVPGAASKVKDRSGQEWDVGTPGAFQFDFVKQADGIRLKKTVIFADSLPAAQILMARGIIKPGQ